MFIRCFSWLFAIALAVLSAGAHGQPYPTKPIRLIVASSAEIGRTLRSPEVAERMQADGVTSSGSTPEELRARIQKEIPMWKRVVARARIKIE